MATTIVNVSRETHVPDLIPARMLNEFAYCPRLAYLEWVQGEFADNLDTIEGRFDHRRVEKPSRKPVPEPAHLHPGPAPEGRATCDGAQPGPLPAEGREAETIHTRSLLLSAPDEGLIAKIDLLELSPAEVVPVDYKHGRVPDVPGGAWEPEQVQLCAQGLILRANGYHCKVGILYFVESRRRVSIPFDERLVDRTRHLIRQMRDMAAAGIVPPPLDDSPKCPRCSLVGICLPDETRLLAATQQDALAPGPSPSRPGESRDVRRLMPARDDALPLYIQEQGTTLGKSGDVLTVSRRGHVLQQVKLIDVSQVCLLGNVQVTAQALREITTLGIPVCHFSYGGWFHALTSGLVHKNVELRIRQFQVAADRARSLDLARRFVVGKIKNGRTLLRRHLEHGQATLHHLAELAQKAEHAADVTTLLGIEGTAAREYFAGFSQLLKGSPTFNLDGRNRRPPRDPVNAMLSFVYAMLIKELTVVLHASGFDPMLGFFHRPRYGRPSLALDLAEEFRPIVADSTVLTLVNNGEVSESSFICRCGGVALTDAGRKAVITAFERRMDTLVTHPLFGYRISYRRILEVQARLLGRTLLGEIDHYPSFCTR